MYIVIERCIDEYYGNSALEFKTKKDLEKYINSNKKNSECLLILGVYKSYNVSHLFLE